MAKPGRYDIETTRGDDIDIRVPFLDANRAPMPLTGRTYAAQVRAHTWDETPLAAFEVTLDAAAGVVTLHIPRATAVAFPDNAVWDFQETAGGKVRTLLSGTVAVRPQVTR